jgi:hypothetical protein
MTVPIVTLVVGVIVVCVSFFVLDSHNFKEEDEIYKESSEDLKLRITELCDDLVEQSKTSIEEYSRDVEKKNEAAIKKEIEKCAEQLSEKAKKEMIEYINQSLAEAYAEYKPEPVTYEEKQEEDTNVTETSDTDAVQKDEEVVAVEDEADVVEAAEAKVEAEENSDANAEEEAVEATGNAEETEAAEATENAEATEADKTELSEDIEIENANDSDAVSVAGSEATTDELKSDNSSPVKDSDKNTEPKNKSNKQRKKNKNRNKNKNNNQSPKKEAPVLEEIWDDEKNIDKEVAELYSNGYGIMEIANQLGIGVGETKVIIKNIENQKQQ